MTILTFSGKESPATKKGTLAYREYELYSSDRLPADPGRTGGKRFVDTSGDDAANIQEELQRYHYESAEHSWHNFHLICT